MLKLLALEEEKVEFWGLVADLPSVDQALAPFFNYVGDNKDVVIFLSNATELKVGRLCLAFDELFLKHH